MLASSSPEDKTQTPPPHKLMVISLLTPHPQPRSPKRGEGSRKLLTSLSIWFCIGALSLVAAEEPKPKSPSPARNDWAMDSIKLKTGRTLHGLMQSQHDNQIEFIEILRPQGKPMSAVLYPLMRKEIESMTLLSKDERKVLARRFELFRHRAMIESGRMQDLTIVEQSRDERPVRVYHGPWFSLTSTADDETTRRCVVRIEQTFRAYRLLLPPRVDERRNLQVLLLGSMDEYRSYLRRERLEIANPAYYSATLNQIVLGSDLSQYSAELAKARARNQSTHAEFVSLGGDLPKRLQMLGEEMKRKGFSRDEIKDELQARRAAWANELQAIEKRIAEIGRRNDARFTQVTQEMFRRLSHEAFHAYVENYVFPRDQGELPRWLNEGLAMIFEGGQLEADALRVDAPSPELLQRLQTDLEAGSPLPLAQLFAADGRSFVKSHQTNGTDRNYLYAWGLAYYLVFDHDLLGSERINDYVATKASDDPIVQFEKLVGEKLDKFEPKWRAAMLKMKRPRS